MGTTAAQKRMFFILGKLKREMQVIDEWPRPSRST
jgi:hypothetical protein